ncbi:O-antigen/teichoic acid export membrane protein [Caulobacter ginsengisoli]|uniref:O-antigen/teichoic acid export membrane protein n=1 Tax=Caulobacter ginsengisoli TaxID=400775 RepID=A0ABU0ISF2_9CAUL|nr:polysaccharide biosynthesis C-terminal domain-containing protein [Caulobacter ginsengisoli]MDQ0464930.1 O-antigen/teichoic acid export membrane protein [Caulobacter ginsengisoli]
MSERRAILRGASVSLVLQVAGLGLGYLGTAVLVRAMRPAEFGVYGFMLSLVTVLVLPAQFGVPTLVIRETAAGRQTGDYAAAKGLLLRSNQFALAAGLLLGLGTLALAAFLPMLRPNLPVLILALATLPLLALTAIRGAALRGLGQVIAGQWPDVALKPALVLVFVALATPAAVPKLTALCLLFGVVLPPAAMSSTLAMALNLIATAIAFLVGLVLLWRAMPDELRRASPRFDSRRWIASAIPLGVGGGIAVLNVQIAVLLMGALSRPPEEIGIYRVVAQTAMLAALGYTAVIATLSPRFAAAQVAGDRAGLQRAASLGAVLSTAVCLPFALFFLAFGGPFLGLVFRPEAAVGGPTLAVLGLAHLFNAAMGCSAAMLNMSGHERDFTISCAVGLVLQTVLALALIPAFGLMGAAIASAVGVVAPNLLLWRYAHLRLGVESAIWGWGRKISGPPL